MFLLSYLCEELSAVSELKINRKLGICLYNFVMYDISINVYRIFINNISLNIYLKHTL